MSELRFCTLCDEEQEAGEASSEVHCCENEILYTTRVNVGFEIKTAIQNDTKIPCGVDWN